uniref:protein xylosyltransferase n=2 Tax=Anopheles marajoara TaxID=58244 RepID=A0A2M4BCE2_9DIPT
MRHKFPFSMIWRYKVFFLIGLLLVSAQIFLAYKLLRLPLTGNETTEERDVSRKLYEKYVKKPSSNQSVGAANDGAEYPNAPRKTVAASTKGKKAASGGQLKLAELPFVLPCEPTSKDAISAINRAKSETCKAKIVEVACEIQKKTFYPHHLPSYCPRGEHSPDRELGCFRDEKAFRLLSSYYTRFKTNNTPERCILLCLQSGYPYAGVQYGHECFCGDETPKVAAKLPDSSCNMKCTGDPKQICGGYFTMNVYETGIRKFAEQSSETIAKREDKPVRIAFLLTLNGRAVRQVHRLLKALYHPQHYYFIHIDARQEYLYRELLKLESSFPNVRLARKRFSTIWGGASLLTMLLSSMEYLLYESGWQWDFVLNLSESDFPLKTVDQLATFLTANRGQNFVRNHGREVQRFIQKQGLDMTFVECDNRMWRIGERTLPTGIAIDGGSDWVCLSREFASYVTAQPDQPDGDGRDELVTGLLRVFGYTILPAESFFHTVLRNSRFCHTYINNNLHMTNWKRQLGCKCQYKHIVDWCGCSPNNFRNEDWERLDSSQHKKLFFARKFEAMVNQAIVLQLEEWIFGSYPVDTLNLHAYWQNFYHHEDSSSGSADGALLNVVQSLLRLNGAAGKEISQRLYEPYRVRELTHYLERDKYQGFLIRYEAHRDDGTALELETWVTPYVKPTIPKTTPLSQRLLLLEVSTDYDEKEQLSRNFQRIISSNSEPTLIFRLSQPAAVQRAMENATNHSLTVEWVGPVGKVLCSSHFTIEDNPAGAPHTFNHFLKASKLHQPLPVGQWSVRLLQGKHLLGSTSFLVTDAIYWGGGGGDASSQSHSHRQVPPLPLDGGRQRLATSRVRTKDQSLQRTRGHANQHHQHSGDDGARERWLEQQQQELDRFVPLFFKLRETCLIRAEDDQEKELNRDPPYVDCAATYWSSVAPDPKSDIYVESIAYRGSAERVRLGN